MTARLLSGVSLAAKIKLSLKARIPSLTQKLGRPPSLAAVALANDASAEVYLQAQTRLCRELDIRLMTTRPRKRLKTQEAYRLLRRVSATPAVDAVILQLPLPRGIDLHTILSAISPEKDAEGVSPQAYGRLFACKSWAELENNPFAAPPTALAIAALIRQAGMSVTGRRAVVIGRSNIVGRPAAHLLSLLDATVTLCHSKSKDLPGEIRRADIVIACAGKASLVRGTWLKRGALLIDAGMNRVGSKLLGDVRFEEARIKASWLTPVPGGVGPVTTAMLFSNVVSLALERLKRR